MTDHKSACYYVMNNKCVEEKNVVFEKHNLGMKSHLKTLFLKAKVDNFDVNTFLADSGTTINLMSHSPLRKVEKFNIDLRSYNIVLSNYKCKIGHSLGTLQVDLNVRVSAKMVLKRL